MRQIVPTLIALLLFSGQNFSQNSNFCRQSPADVAALRARLDQNLAQLPTAADRSTVFVPIRFHLVGDAAGKNRWSHRRVLDLLCEINRDFAQAGIQFFLSEENGSIFNENLSNDLAFNLPESATPILEAARSQKAVNAFIVKELGTPGLLLGYYSFAHDWLVFSHDIDDLDFAAAAHELGHFFSLLHTFHGFDLFFGQIQPNVVPPFNIGGQPLELMDGSNCHLAADQLCDTPPDYGVPTVSQGCQSVPNILDPNGVPIDPMENNMMAAYAKCADYDFTKQQIEAMLADLATPPRNYLKNTFQPPATSLVVPSDLLVAPAQNEKIEIFDHVELDWKSVAGATHYLVEVSFLQNFPDVTTQSWIVTEDFLTVNSLQKNRKYHWRVRPFNHSATCEVQQTGTFSTGQTSGSTQFLGNENRVSVFPNPLSGTENLHLRFDFAQAEDLQVEVSDAAGRLAFSKKMEVQGGVSSDELPATSLPEGLFLLKILGARGGSAVWKIFK